MLVPFTIFLAETTFISVAEADIDGITILLSTARNSDNVIVYVNLFLFIF
ncbi:hypothetical protein [Clostridium saccharoperbutylacetonicum]